METKRIRKANFSHIELQTLLDEISVESTLLFSSHSQTVTQKKKKEILQKIVDSVNSCGVALRTPTDCRDKWKGLKGAVLNCQCDTRKTGGGPTPPPVPFEDLILSIIGRNTALISGIPGTAHTKIIFESVLNQETFYSEECAIHEATCFNSEVRIGD
jgi:hypothetical protein